MIDDGWVVGWGGGRVTLLPSMGPTDGGEERRDVSLSLSLFSFFPPYLSFVFSSRNL